MTQILNPNTSFWSRRREVLICLFLILMTLVAYWQVQYCDFVNLDDHEYVDQNKLVSTGIRLENIVKAFEFKGIDYWRPITWLSHMLDVELFGLNPGMHHLTSLLFHLGNTLLLFIVLKQMTGALWKSGFVAALFALHPLNVESVAWVAERKNVLSTFFWMLTLLIYAYYAKKPDIKKYISVLVVFALGLMTKPMLVTLPCVMFLLDYWPLGRMRLLGSSLANNVAVGQTGQPNFQRTPVVRLVLEKIPFLALAAISIFLSLSSHGQVISYQTVPLNLRVANALVSYVGYMAKMVWPQKLAIFYPYPTALPNLQVAGAGLLLAGISIAALRNIRSRPYLAVGWLWYLGTLVPVLGILQWGLWPAMADRFAYVPLIGLFILVAWGIPEGCLRWRHSKVCLFAGTTILLLVLTITTRVQVGYWKNSMALFEHALKVTSNNYLAHNGVGVELKNQGRIDEAQKHYLEALRIKPDFEKTQNNLGFVLYRKGDNQGAIKHYMEALRIKPHFAAAHSNLGLALETEGRMDEAIFHFSEALRLKPDAGAHVDLGVALFRKGDIREAAKHYIAALNLQPDSVDAHYNLGIALERVGQIDKAVRQYRAALSIQPDYVGAHNNLGIALEKKGRLDEAIDHYLQALRIMPDFEEAHNNLGIALFRKGDIRGAIDHFREALRIEPDNVYAKDNLERALMEQQRNR